MLVLVALHVSKRSLLLYSQNNIVFMTSLLHMMIAGSYVLDVEASPMIRDVTVNVTKQMTSLDQGHFRESGIEEQPLGVESLYDLWVRRSPSEADSSLPR